MELGGSFATPATDPTIIDATATVVRPEFGGTEEAAQRAVHNRLGLSRRGMNVVRAGLAVVALAVVADRFIPSSPATGAAEVSALAQGPGLVNGNTLNGGADCVTSGELYKNIAVTNTPSTEAIFQSLLTQPDKQGQQQLVSEAEAISKSREQVCGSTLALATITVIRELREKLQVPGQNILDLINQKVQSYDVNPTAATTDEELAYQFLGFMKANTQFPITTGNASRLVALNDQKTQIAGQAVTGTNNFSGMEFYFNTDDASLTPEQKHIADFWDDNPFKMNVTGHVMFGSKKFSPPGHWMSIVGITSQKAKVDYGTMVTAYAKTSIAFFDAFIQAWYTKYKFNAIRPETVINKYLDPNWRPYLQTPAFPEYTCGHNTISASAAEALTSVLGDNLAFTDSTELEFGIKNRSFPSIRKAAEELNWARFYGGVHFHNSCVISLQTGRKVGDLVVDRLKMKK